MLTLISKTVDIYYNLATEEYLLKEFSEDCLMLWQSETCLVVGKHQNAIAEINQAFIREQSIPVARRLSGGGTVYHGKGNLNFTFIRNGQPGKLVDFHFFVSPVVSYLATLGIRAEIGKKNDILINGQKISGNAEHIYKNRVLHHGTLLFDADLSELNRSIEVTAGQYKDKAVQSNRSVVTNIIGHLDHKLSLEAFEQGLYRYLQENFPGAGSYELTPSDTEKITQLRDQKYSREEWIYGYSPNFEVNGNIRYSGQDHPISCQVKKGAISGVSILTGDAELDRAIFAVLMGKPFRYADLETALRLEEAVPDEVGEAILAVLFYQKGQT
ncbi:MAG: lipoate--protein ligase [Bacteroidales bacterium]|nr:lipoate--protein ligase [Bacteroidales bacterium]